MRALLLPHSQLGPTRSWVRTQIRALGSAAAPAQEFARLQHADIEPSPAFAAAETSWPTQPPRPAPQPSSTATSDSTAPTKKTARKPRPRKAVLTLLPAALDRLRLIQSTEGKLIKVSVVAKGCAGGAYKLEYVDRVDKFDEVVEQDGVKVLVDAKSLMKLIGSKMSYQDDLLASRFVFDNPNVVSTCGCEESFATKEDEERLLKLTN
ncbi:Iron-sulfur assembly protein 1 [Savitreella phatthalungensis]